MKEVVIDTRLTLPDFVKVNFIVQFRRMNSRLLMLVIVLMIIFPAAFAVARHIPFHWVQSVIGLGMAVFYVASTAYTARKNFYANAVVREPLRYIFRKGGIGCESSAGTTVTDWAAVYRVTETRDCLIIWKNREVINLIPRRDVSGTQREAIKAILQQYQVRNNLG